MSELIHFPGKEPTAARELPEGWTLTIDRAGERAGSYTAPDDAEIQARSLLNDRGLWRVALECRERAPSFAELEAAVTAMVPRGAMMAFGYVTSGRVLDFRQIVLDQCGAEVGSPASLAVSSTVKSVLGTVLYPGPGSPT